MKNGFVKAVIQAASIALILLVTASCQKETTVRQKGSVTNNKTTGTVVKPEVKQSSDKAARALAAENIELKKQLAQKDQEIETLNKKVANREVDKEAVRIAVKKEMERRNNEILKMLTNMGKLQEENKALKKQIEELKAGNTPK
jgi:predicted RNase H-like nuclease (RuvC/YqgF family)